MAFLCLLSPCNPNKINVTVRVRVSMCECNTDLVDTIQAIFLLHLIYIKRERTLLILGSKRLGHYIWDFMEKLVGTLQVTYFA